jgi:hypothetical protein
MIIPRNKAKRDEKVQWIASVCKQSQEDRRAIYDRRKRYFLYGTYGQETVRYNRLYAHMDLVAAFLFAEDHARFSISAPRNSAEAIVKQMLAAEDDWNDTFRDSGLAAQYGVNLLWSLVYDSMFIKMGWNSEREELFGRTVLPSAMGVFDESDPDLDSQEAFTHTYSLDWDNTVLRLARAGKLDLLPKLTIEFGPKTSDYPPVLAHMLEVSQTGGTNISGPVVGSVPLDYEPKPTYEPMSDAPSANFTEVYVWDDITEDYAIFVTVDNGEGSEVISDSRDTVDDMAKETPAKFAEWGSQSNIFLPNEHPFIHIRPYTLPEYFWGEAHIERLIPLQRWTNERLDQIADILERQVDPAKVFSGFTGLQDEKASALGGPGSWVVEPMNTGAKVDTLAPDMPEDLFAEFQAIGAIFLEASGLTETVTGKGEAGVRGRGHAKQLATTGSARIRKIGVGLEQSLMKLGDVGMKLKAKNDDTLLKADDGKEFVLAQLAAAFKLRVAGHSHSPLFADEAKEDAGILLKAQAIDQEMFIRLINPPNADNMIHSLRARLKAKAEAIKANPELAQQKPHRAKAA